MPGGLEAWRPGGAEDPRTRGPETQSDGRPEAWRTRGPEAWDPKAWRTKGLMNNEFSGSNDEIVVFAIMSKGPFMIVHICSAYT